jgi:hypothetical protein
MNRTTPCFVRVNEGEPKIYDTHTVYEKGDLLYPGPRMRQVIDLSLERLGFDPLPWKADGALEIPGPRKVVYSNRAASEEYGYDFVSILMKRNRGPGDVYYIEARGGRRPLYDLRVTSGNGRGSGLSADLRLSDDGTHFIVLPPGSPYARDVGGFPMTGGSREPSKTARTRAIAMMEALTRKE